MRSNLLSLQNTQSLMDTTQERLSTGKKVNSAIDNPSSYYTAQSLSNRASDLSALLDSMGQGIQTIKAADEAITSITKFAEQAKALANTARDEAIKNEGTAITGIGALADKAVVAMDVSVTDADGKEVANAGFSVTAAGAMTKEEVQAEVLKQLNDTQKNPSIASASFNDKGELVVTAKAGYTATFEDVSSTSAPAGTLVSAPEVNASRQKSAAQFDEILSQIDQLAKDASYKGVNLLQGNDLKVVFNEDRSSSIVVKGQDGSSKGLGMTAAVGDWQKDSDIDSAITSVEKAISTLRTMASEFGNNYSVVQNREEFTENLINVLTEGSDKLTLADMNEESANMLALQTRQQLAINSLSLASQASQSVLKLF